MTLRGLSFCDDLDVTRLNCEKILLTFGVACGILMMSRGEGEEQPAGQ